MVIDDAAGHTVGVSEADAVFTAHCSCGWTGKPARSEGVAESDGLAHLNLTM